MGQYGINLNVREMVSILSLIGINTKAVYDYQELSANHSNWAYWVYFSDETRFIAVALPTKPEKERFMWAKQEFSVEDTIVKILHDVKCGCSSCCFNLLEAIHDNNADVEVNSYSVTKKMQDYYNWKTPKR